MLTSRRPLWIACSALSLSLLAIPSLAGSSAVPPVALVQAAAEGVVWVPQVDHAALVLTVAQPGGAVFRVETAAGEVPRFDLYDGEGCGRPDGVYVWELRATPRTAGKPDTEAGLSGTGTSVGARAGRRQVQSGTFALLAGVLYLPGELHGEEPSEAAAAPGHGEGDAGFAERDQVVGDELIVQGRACVGFDCAGGEAFGDDVLRLKENSLVLRLEDTSAGGGFPTNDWQLRSNDPASGGAERFSIEDADGGTVPFTLEAGAPTDSLRLDAQGRIGLGTATPAADLHLVRGDAPALRLEQDGTLGQPLQSWQLTGDEGALALADLTAGTTPLRVAAAAPTDSLVVDGAGRLGVGTASPAERLDVAGAGTVRGRITAAASDGTAGVLVQETSGTEAVRVLFELINNGRVRFEMTDTSANGQKWTFFTAENDFIIASNSVAGQEFRLDENGNLVITGAMTATGFLTSSSRRLKRDVEPVDPVAVLDRLRRLEVAEWSFSHDAGRRRHLGPMAEEFHAAFGLGGNDGTVSLLDVAGVALAAVQGLTVEVEERDRRIAELEARLAALEAHSGLAPGPPPPVTSPRSSP